MNNAHITSIKFAFALKFYPSLINLADTSQPSVKEGGTEESGIKMTGVGYSEDGRQKKSRYILLSWAIVR